MDVKDPTTGQTVTVPMRRDLPGYHVSRARKSPRMRWSLPVDIQWQSECIMKFLGQSCACCDVLTGGSGANKENEQGGAIKTEQLAKPPRARGGVDTVIVDPSTEKNNSSEGQTEITSTTTTIDYNYKLPHEGDSSSAKGGNDVNERLSLQGLDMFAGFPIPSKSPGLRQNRRRRQLISTTEMLMPKSTGIPGDQAKGPQNAFDIMESHISSRANVEESSHSQADTLANLPGIAEEECTDKV